jgi:hypothetical protein
MSVTTSHGPHPLRPQNFGELVEFAKMAARSSLVPRDYLGKPENILLAIQMGSEIGLAPMQSLQNIAVISGRPAVFGDAMLGLCRQSPTCKDVIERFEGEGKELTAVCIAKRVGAEPIERRFSIDDAERANLLGKPGPWQQYPKRMLQMRARGFALRDAFPDVLRGMISTEEAQDIPEEKFAGTTLDADPEPPAPIRAAAAPMARADRIAEKAPAYEAPPQPKQTIGQFLDALELAMRDCDTLGAVNRLIASPKVVQARQSLKNGALERLESIIASGLAAHAPVTYPTDDDGDAASEDLDEVQIAGAEKLAAGD